TTLSTVVFDPGNPPFGIILTPAFARAYHPVTFFWGADVRLRPGVDVQHFEDAASALVANSPVPDDTLAFQTRHATETRAQRTIPPYPAALLAFTIPAAVLALLIAPQPIPRQLGLEAAEQPVLQGLGMVHRQRFAAAMVRVGLTALPGVLIGLV